MTAKRSALLAALALALAVVVVIALVSVRPAGPATVATATASPTASVGLTQATPPPASATASATAAAAGPSPTASSAGATLRDDLGWLVLDLQEPRFTIRTERESRAVATFSGHAPAVSPDGRRVAYWRSQVLPSNHELRVFDVASPGNELTLRTLTPAERGGGVVWSNDGTALLFAIHTVSTTGGAGAGPRGSTMETYDLTSRQAPGGTSSELPVTDGKVYVPVAWDRAGGLATAVITGEGGFATEYVMSEQRVLAPGQRSVTRVPMPAGITASSVRASPDAKRVLGLDVRVNVLKVWPLRDVSAAFEVRPGPGTLTGARWDADSQQIGWTYGDRFDVFTPQTSSSRTVYRGATGLLIGPFRSDGSAATALEPPGIGRALLVPVTGGAPVEIPGARDGMIESAIRLR